MSRATRKLSPRFSQLAACHSFNHFHGFRKCTCATCDGAPSSPRPILPRVYLRNSPLQINGPLVQRVAGSPVMIGSREPRRSHLCLEDSFAQGTHSVAWQPPGFPSILHRQPSALRRSACAQRSSARASLPLARSLGECAVSCFIASIVPSNSSSAVTAATLTPSVSLTVVDLPRGRPTPLALEPLSAVVWQKHDFSY